MVFGRKNDSSEGNRHVLRFFVTNPIEAYDGPMPMEPFGHSIVNAQSREIPSTYHGRWVKRRFADDDQPEQRGGRVTLEITERSLNYAGWSEPVVAVVTGEENSLPQSECPEIAVVSEYSNDDGSWAFSLVTFGLADDGNTLIDIESEDSPWVRRPERS